MNRMRVVIDEASDPIVVSVHGNVYFGVHDPLLEALVALAAGEDRRKVLPSFDSVAEAAAG